jgi:HPt (histidine-containing phosphotransfer) domain-containing protein
MIESRQVTTKVLLDHQQLRDLTMGDTALMQEVVQTLIDDTRRQIPLIEEAISRHDSVQLMHLAHYCKGACDGIGARSSAVLLGQIRIQAGRGDFTACRDLLASLSGEIERLSREAALPASPGAPLAAPHEAPPGRAARHA